MSLRSLFSRQKEFERLTWSYGGQLYRLAFSRMANQQDAEDAVQETYLRAYRSFHTFRPSSNIRAWLITILFNVMRDHFDRKQRSVPVVNVDENSDHLAQIECISSEGKNPEEQFCEQDLDPILLAQLRSLPTIFLYPLLLREIEDMTYEEIAGILDVPVGTVMSRLFRARQTLRLNLNLAAHKPQENEELAARNESKFSQSKDESHDHV